MRLGIDGPGAPEHARPPRPAAQPRVRVVESNAEFVVLEVTCACGAVTHVRCDYPAANAPTPQGPAKP